MDKIIALMTMLVFFLSAQAKLVTKEYDYKQDTVQFKGFVAFDNEQKGKRPAVLVAPEWWGLNDALLRQENVDPDRIATIGYGNLPAGCFRGKIIMGAWSGCRTGRAATDERVDAGNYFSTYI